MSGDLETRQRALRIARVDLHQKAQKLGAIANHRGPVDRHLLAAATDVLEQAARAFVRAELDVELQRNPGPRPIDGGTT